MVSTFSRTKKEGSRIKISNLSSEKRCFIECLLIVSDTRWYTRTLLFMLAFALHLRPQSRSFIKRYHKIPLKQIETSLGCKIKLNEKHQSLSFLPSVIPITMCCVPSCTLPIAIMRLHHVHSVYIQFFIS